MTSEPRESTDYTPGELDAVLDFLKRMRYEFRELRMLRTGTDYVQVFDVNHDSFLIRGLGFPHADVAAVLDAVNAVYNRRTIHDPTDRPYKEFKTGRRRNWAVDRVM